MLHVPDHLSTSHELDANGICATCSLTLVPEQHAEPAGQCQSYLCHIAVYGLQVTLYKAVIQCWCNSSVLHLPITVWWLLHSVLL